MSKKRSWSLSSKAKLSKSLKDYQEHMQKRKQGGAGYAKEPHLVKHRTKKSGKYCKRLKGEHDFVPKEIKKFSFWPGNIKTYKCSGCGKEKYEWDRSPFDKE